MKLPWKSRTRTSPPSPEEPPVEVAPCSATHPSPGLEAVLRGCQRGDALRVLDLGPALPENIEILSGFATRIQVVDVMRKSFDANQAIHYLGTLVPEHKATFHLVFLWDYLNYLSPDQGAALVEAVAPLCCPDARCLAMVYASETMPAVPQKYRIVDESHLTYEWSITEMLGAPRMTPAAVERALLGFSIEHAFVLRNGVREFVATRDPVPATGAR